MDTLDIAIDPEDLAYVTGGAAAPGTDFESIKEQARPYCPATVDRYTKVDPSTIDRSLAEQMGAECVQEINPLFRGVARGRIQAGIDKAFPK